MLLSRKDGSRFMKVALFLGTKEALLCADFQSAPMSMIVPLVESCQILLLDPIHALLLKTGHDTIKRIDPIGN